MKLFALAPFRGLIVPSTSLCHVVLERFIVGVQSIGMKLFLKPSTFCPFCTSLNALHYSGTFAGLSPFEHVISSSREFHICVIFTRNRKSASSESFSVAK